MKDFQLRNDTKLLFRNNPVKDLKEYVNKKKVLFVYGGGSVKRNGCYNDVKKAIDESDGKLFELSGASREIIAIEKGIQLLVLVERVLWIVQNLLLLEVIKKMTCGII